MNKYKYTLFNQQQIDNNNKIDIDKLIVDVYNNLMIMKSMSVREYLIYKKFQEIMSSKHKVYEYEYLYKLHIPTTLEEVQKVYENIIKYHSINVELISDQKHLDLFNILLKGTTLMEIVSNPGRNLKFIISETITKKVIGFLIIGSDILSIKDRDNYIGWDKECKLEKGRLQNICIGRIIVPTQPFGYLLNGGKLVALLLNHENIRHSWKQKYDSDLVMVTTTSLFGRPSMYDGTKYIKNVGETKGTIFFSPDNEIMKKIHRHLKENYPDEYNKAIKQSGPKQKVLQLFFNKYKQKFLKLDSDFNIKYFQHGFVRGIYLIPFYEVNHLRDYLTCKIDSIDKNYLIFKSPDEIIDYWGNKFAEKRYNKVKNNVNLSDPYFLSHYSKLITSNFNFQKFLSLNMTLI